MLDSQTKKIKHLKKKFKENKSNFIPNIIKEIKINLTTSKKIKYQNNQTYQFYYSPTLNSVVTFIFYQFTCCNDA